MYQIRQSTQRSKLNKLFAEQVNTHFLEKKYGVVNCCPEENLPRALELFEFKETLEFYFPEEPQAAGCLADGNCQKLLIEKINIL